MCQERDIITVCNARIMFTMCKSIIFLLISLYCFKEDERRSERSHRPEAETFEEGSDEGEYTDADDFIVDDDGRPIAEKRKKKRPIFSDAYVVIFIVILSF